MKKLINVTLMLLLFSVITLAQKKDYSTEPGYIDFGNLEEFENDNRVVDVFLEGNLLKLVGKFTEDEDPELAKLIQGLKLIKAKVLELTSKNEDALNERVKKIESELENKNWDRLVRIRDRHENVNVYLKSPDLDNIEGLVVTVINGDEAAFVNIVGKINLETIGKLSKKFDIPGIDKINGRGSH